MKNTVYKVILLLILFVNHSVFAQTEEPADQTLRGLYQDMLDKSENYTDYKVIRNSRLDNYSRAVTDSISKYRYEISALNNQVKDQKSQITQLSNRISDLEKQLSDSERLRESLTFLGIPFNKTTYHTLVWLIIGILAGFGLFIYFSFMRSKRITTKTRREIKEIELEYEEHKKKSHEKQIKMGRELQTERNLVEELKTKLKAKPPVK